jgi:hypothetical protein
MSGGSEVVQGQGSSKGEGQVLSADKNYWNGMVGVLVTVGSLCVRGGVASWSSRGNVIPLEVGVSSFRTSLSGSWADWGRISTGRWTAYWGKNRKGFIAALEEMEGPDGLFRSHGHSLHDIFSLRYEGETFSLVFETFFEILVVL